MLFVFRTDLYSDVINHDIFQRGLCKDHKSLCEVTKYYTQKSYD